MSDRAKVWATMGGMAAIIVGAQVIVHPPLALKLELRRVANAALTVRDRYQRERQIKRDTKGVLFEAWLATREDVL